MTYGSSHSLDVFYGLGDIARKYKVSMKEVDETILRVALRKVGAIQKCKHLAEDVIYRRDKSRPHCRNCWTWMNVISRPSRDGGYKGEFEPDVSELEEYLEKTLEMSLGEELK